MLYCALFGLLSLSPPPLKLDFDADKTGQVPALLESSAVSAAFVVAADPTGTAGNKVLSIDTAFAAELPIVAFLKETSLQDFDFTARVRTAPHADPKKLTECGMLFRATENRSCQVSLNAAENLIQIRMVDAGEPRVLAAAALPKADAAHWYTIHISLSSGEVKCTVDGEQLLMCTSLPVLTYGKIGLFASPGTTCQLDDIVIQDTAPELTQSLQIRGMTCVLCEAKIENALKAIKGVKNAKADHASGTCLITLDENAPADVQELIKAVEALHYKVHIEGA